MKRLITLTALLVCSLTLYGADAHAQTWRLTNDAFSDSLPQLIRDNIGRVWVVWLSNVNGDFDPCVQMFMGVSWSSTNWLNTDAINQHCVRIAYDGFNDRIWTVWDSSRQLQGSTYHEGSWEHTSNLLDSDHLLFYADSIGFHPFRLATNDSGLLCLAWSSGFPDSMGICSRCCNDTTWDTTEIAMQIDYIQSWYGGAHYICDLVAHHSGKAIVADSNVGWTNIITATHNYLDFTYWVVDSGWAPYYFNTYAGSSYSVMGGSSGNRASVVSISVTENGDALFIYNDKVGTDSVCLTSKRFSGSPFLFDSTLVIKAGVTAVSGSTTSDARPTLAWSDSHTIFLNTYYDTMWSKPPVRISDEALVNCINPDIVAENDSTVWVCYQNDGDIYVTRTSVPLGVSEKPIDQIPNPKSKIGLKSWPNPASNVIHFSYTLPAKRNSSVSVYDIAGRLVKTLGISDNQINWNCADHAGRRVASGVYFARLRSGGQETIQRISIIK